MRVLFIGGTKRGFLTLKALLEAQINVIGVISLQQDDHELDRSEGAIRSLAGQFNLPLYETKWMKDRDYGLLIRDELKPDLAFAVGCRILIPKEIYELVPAGVLAVHDSYLPEYRGFAPLNWAILNGEDHTGVTMFYLSELMDGGDIVLQKRVPIGPEETAPQVYELVCQATVDLVLEAYPLFEQGRAPRLKQDYTFGTFTCSRNPDDGYIDWERPTREIYNQVRALTRPYPGAFTYYKNRKLMIWSAGCPAEMPRYVGRVPGRVVAISGTTGHVDVLTGDGILRIREIQLEGMEAAPAPAVITSVRATLGLRVPDLVARIAQLEGRIK